jgi:hypothetical protein
MRHLKAIAVIAVFAVADAIVPGQAQPAPGSAAVPTIYVGEFQPVDAAQGHGPLGAIASTMHANTVDQGAKKLSDALVAALHSRKISVMRLHEADPLPAQGWIVRGVLYSLDKESHLVSLPFHKSNQGPNVEVSVTIADASSAPGKPFAIVGTDAALKGQGSALSWNPYIIGAKLVIDKAESDSSIAKLAQQIADKILQARPTQ